MNLIPILQKHFKEGDRLYSMIHGWVTLYSADPSRGVTYPIAVETSGASRELFTCDGRYFEEGGECILFPDHNKDWSKFVEANEGDAVVYLEDGTWHLGRAVKVASYKTMGVRKSNGDVYLPPKMIPAELFDFNNFENIKL